MQLILLKLDFFIDLSFLFISSVHFILQVNPYLGLQVTLGFFQTYQEVMGKH